MLSSTAFSVIIGAACGVLAGLGIGGGSLLMLWLTAVLGTAQQTARAVNLLFFIPAALSVSIFRWRQGQLEIRTILPSIISGCIAALGGSLLADQLDQQLLQKCFGALLIITGIRELFYRRKKAR